MGLYAFLDIPQQLSAILQNAMGFFEKFKCLFKSKNNKSLG